MMAREGELQVVELAELPGWDDDDHAAALAAFCLTQPIVRARAVAGDLQRVLGELPAPSSLVHGDARREAKSFFEANFIAYRWSAREDDAQAGGGLLTGYFEPIIDGSLEQSARFSAALMLRPGDLVNLVSEDERGAKAGQPTHARRTERGLEPYPTRQQIEDGALQGRGLEICYADPVDVFVVQVQGSGLVRLEDGRLLRLTYDGKNGHPYTSVGRWLIERGVMSAQELTLKTMMVWLKADAPRGRQAMQQNASYVFFRVVEEAATAPLGVLGTPLVEGRSLAVDTTFHALGTPIFVTAPDVRFGGKPLARLMVAHDVGSAIRGRERGDFFCGSGAEAGALAGVMKHACVFTMLLPRVGWDGGQRR